MAPSTPNTPAVAQTADQAPDKPEPEIREQKVKDPHTGKVRAIRVKILKGGRRREA